MGKQLWTAERTEHAQKLWREGISAAAIAERLGGVTRNGVIGRMNRTLGKKDNESAARSRAMSGRMKVASDKPRKPRGPKPKPINWHPTRKPPSHFHDRAATPAELAASADDWRALKAEMERQDAGRTDLVANIIDLEEHQCRWPVGDPTRGFCGASKVPGKSYCAHHVMRSASGFTESQSQTYVRIVAHRSSAGDSRITDPEGRIAELHETVAA